MPIATASCSSLQCQYRSMAECKSTFQTCTRQRCTFAPNTMTPSRGRAGEAFKQRQSRHSLSRLASVSAAEDLNNVSGLTCACGTQTLNKPSGVADYGICLTLLTYNGWKSQIYIPNWGNNMCARSFDASGWTSWRVFSA